MTTARIVRKPVYRPVSEGAGDHGPRDAIQPALPVESAPVAVPVRLSLRGSVVSAAIR